MEARVWLAIINRRFASVSAAAPNGLPGWGCADLAVAIFERAKLRFVFS